MKPQIPQSTNNSRQSRLVYPSFKFVENSTSETGGGVVGDNQSSHLKQKSLVLANSVVKNHKNVSKQKLEVVNQRPLKRDIAPSSFIKSQASVNSRLTSQKHAGTYNRAKCKSVTKCSKGSKKTKKLNTPSVINSTANQDRAQTSIGGAKQQPPYDFSLFQFNEESSVNDDSMGECNAPLDEGTSLEERLPLEMQRRRQNLSQQLELPETERRPPLAL